MESFLGTVILLCVFLLVYRYLYQILDSIKLSKQKIYFLNQEIESGKEATLKKFRSKAHFDKPHRLVISKFMETDEYRIQIERYQFLLMRKDKFWRLEGPIYIIVLLLCILALNLI